MSRGSGHLIRVCLIRVCVRPSHPCTLSPPIKSFGFEGFDSSRLLILRGRNSHDVEFYRGSPGKFDSRTLYRKIIDRWTGRMVS